MTFWALCKEDIITQFSIVVGGREAPKALHRSLNKVLVIFKIIFNQCTLHPYTLCVHSRNSVVTSDTNHACSLLSQIFSNIHTNPFKILFFKLIKLFLDIFICWIFIQSQSRSGYSICSLIYLFVHPSVYLFITAPPSHLNGGFIWPK